MGLSAHLEGISVAAYDVAWFQLMIHELGRSNASARDG
jgi:hypothetical protein